MYCLVLDFCKDFGFRPSVLGDRTQQYESARNDSPAVVTRRPSTFATARSNGWMIKNQFIISSSGKPCAVVATATVRTPGAAATSSRGARTCAPTCKQTQRLCRRSIGSYGDRSWSASMHSNQRTVPYVCTYVSFGWDIIARYRALSRRRSRSRNPLPRHSGLI